MTEDHPAEAESRFDCIVIASSAGGMEPLLQILSGLPPDFHAAVIVVQHLHPDHKSYLASIASRRTPLQVKQAQDGDRILPGHIYTAPPGSHVVVGPDQKLALTKTELKNYVRPSADILFESAAQVYRDRLIAVVISGSGKDGKEGIRKVKQVGGFTIAQDRETAAYFDMPQAAISTGMVDLVLPIEEIAPSLLLLVKTGAVI
jgi:two-component system, chemotaxis family, protein-glutamate methylesterase/glutaminase